jgi:hypothetical protein
MKKSTKKLVFIIANIVICFGIILLGHIWPEGVEDIYSRNIYPLLVNALNLVSRPFPFSLTEIYFVILAIFLLSFMVLWLFFSVKKEFVKGLDYLLRFFMLISVNVTLFLVLWGMNNYRLNIEDLFAFENQQISQVDLEETYQWFVEQANFTKEQLQDEELLSLEDIMMRTDEGYAILADEYEFIRSRKARVKPLSISGLFSQSGYSGIYLYVFSEPTINIMPHITSLPFVASHEMAHQQGFASEDDANFVGFLAASHHEEALFRYSAYLAGVTYVGNSLYQTDAEAYKRINVSLHENVREDLQARSEFWQKNIRPKTEKVHNQVNDLFLKANNQPDGILNYSNVTKLLVLAYKNERLDK